MATTSGRGGGRRGDSAGPVGRYLVCLSEKPEAGRLFSTPGTPALRNFAGFEFTALADMVGAELPPGVRSALEGIASVAGPIELWLARAHAVAIARRLIACELLEVWADAASPEEFDFGLPEFHGFGLPENVARKYADLSCCPPRCHRR
jgi:hypothetical protein